ncbi:MAG: Veg family protein [Bacillota bacterium]
MNKDHRPISLSQIRHHLEEYLGKSVTVKANRGRRRIVERQGTLEETYPDVFLVRLGASQHNRSISFTYADVLTSDVEVLICGEGEPQKLEISAGS